MILIADSGSTKTDWLLFENNGNDVAQCSTIGMNPFFTGSQDIVNAIADSEIQKYATKVTELYFYGAGCSTSEKTVFLQSTFRKIFMNAEIEVKTDIEGAVIALSDSKPCIVCILGTGSTFRVFNGENIISKYSSMGYIVGDEGSGTHISKALLRHVFYKMLKPDLESKFFNYFKLTREEIVSGIYEKPFPNRFLASFVPFCYDNLHEPIIENIVLKSLNEFIDTHIARLNESKDYPVHFIGSIAHYFELQLRIIAEKHHITIGKIERKPLQAIKRAILEI